MLTIRERLLELNKPAALERVTVRRHTGDSELASGPMSFEPRDSDGETVFTVGSVSFTPDDVVEIDDDQQIVWVQP